VKENKMDTVEYNGRYKEARELTKKDNMVIMRSLVKDWTLGPAEAEVSVNGNKRFWVTFADKMMVSEKEGRRKRCGNCEYGDYSEGALEAMEHVPYNKYDIDGGGRVWCEKFDFICHNLRVCQAHESKY